jgi:hypothetical protein
MAMKVSRRVPALFVSTLLAGGLAAAPAIAQSYGNNPGYSNSQAPHSGSQAPAMAGTTQSGTSWSIENMARQRLSELYDTLRITPQQQPAWNRFAQTSMQNATTLDQLYRQRAGSLQSMNAVQNMETFARIQQQQAQDMQRVLPEFQALYAQLSPQQQQAADQMFRNYSQRAQSRVSQR